MPSLLPPTLIEVDPRLVEEEAISETLEDPIPESAAESVPLHVVIVRREFESTPVWSMGKIKLFFNAHKIFPKF